MPARAVSKVTQKNVETWAVGECLKPHKIARQKFAQVYGLGLQIWLLLHKQIRLILCLPERARSASRSGFCRLRHFRRHIFYIEDQGIVVWDGTRIA